MRFGFNFGLGSRISKVAALILYNMDKFFTEVDDTRTINNEGSLGDAIMYGSNHIFKGYESTIKIRTNNINEDKFLLYYDSDAKKFIKVGRKQYGPEQVVPGSIVAANFSPYVNNTVIDDGVNGVKITFVDHSYGAPIAMSVANGTLIADTSIGKKYDFIVTTKRNVGNQAIKLVQTNQTAYPIETFTDLVYPFEPTNTQVPTFQESNMSAGEVIWIKDISLKEIVSELTIGSYYSIPSSFQNAIVTAKEMTDADITILNGNPRALMELWFGSLTTGLSITKADIDFYYPGNEGVAGGSTVWDMTRNVLVGDTTNKVLNGDFSLGVSGWLPYSGGAYTVVAGECNITGDGSANYGIYQSMNVNVGSAFDVSFDVQNIDSAGVTIFSNDTTPSIIITHTSTTRQTYTFRAYPHRTPFNLYFDVRSSTGTAIVDNVSVKEVFEDVVIDKYVPDCRERLLNSTFGMTNMRLTLDVNGVTTGIISDGTIVGGLDGREIVIPMDSSGEYILPVTKNIDMIKGDNVMAKVSYTDTTSITLNGYDLDINLGNVMLLGDSITEGIGDGNTGDEVGYRGALWTELHRRNYTLTYVGDYDRGVNYQAIDPTFMTKHQGVGGRTTAIIDTLINGFLTTHNPSVIILHAGTNDLWLGANTPAQTMISMVGILDKIKAFDPTILTVVAKINDWEISNQPSLVPDFNNLLTAEVNTRITNGDNLIMADVYGAINWDNLSNVNDDITSGPHPTATGYSKIAKAFVDSIDGFYR